MGLSKEEIEIYRSIIIEIANMPELKEMKKFIQHGNVSCYEHCLSVAYMSFVISRKLCIKVDDVSLVRGALLHDFFLYDWHIKEQPRKLHGFYHPSIAYSNASKLLCLNEVEKDIILKHMWPLTIVPPKYKEAYIICLADKICTIKETFNLRIKLGKLGT